MISEFFRSLMLGFIQCSFSYFTLKYPVISQCLPYCIPLSVYFMFHGACFYWEFLFFMFNVFYFGSALIFYCWASRF